MRSLRLAIGCLALMHGVGAAPNEPVFTARQYGAVGDGSTLDTRALQSAIDRCSSAGGGQVLVAGGQFLTGTLHLRSNVHLRIESGASILGSPRIADYGTDTDRTMYRGEPHMDRCLIFARGADNIWIDGPGVIDGQGQRFPEPGDPGRNRPKLIRLIDCHGIRVTGVRLQSPASWTTEWRYCTDLVFDGVTIHSRANINGDGLDLDGCERVQVRRCQFDTSDDSICLQTSSPDHPCEDVVVNDCRFTSRWAGLRIGLLSRGDIQRVRVTRCDFHDHRDSGIKIQMNEGAEIQDLAFSDLTMRNVPRPVFITFCQQNAWVDAPAGLPPMKRMRHLSFSHIDVDDSALTGPVAKTCGFQMTGMPGHPIEDVSFSRITAVFPGGGSAADARNVLAELSPAVLARGWPEYSRFGATVPAYGFFARHVKGLTLRDVRIRVSGPDGRPKAAFIDVSGLQESDVR